MWASAKHLLACAILLALGHASHAEYDVNAYCHLVKDGTKLGSIDSCKTYYVCQKGVATKQSCASTESYDKNAQTCKLSSQVVCYYDAANPCAGAIDGSFVPIAGTCDGWIYCMTGKEAGRGSCGALTFKNGQCTYDTCTITSTGGGAGTLQSACEVVPSNMYFGDFTDCTGWHYCDSTNKHTSGKCTTTSFNIQRGTCSYDACIPMDVVGTIPDTDTQQVCTAADEGTVKPDPTKCSVYYTCKSLKYVKSTCAAGSYFNEATKTCKPRQQATPISTCDRCEGSTQQFVNAVSATCDEYLYCKNGVKVSSTTPRLCATGTYFNEAAQGCYSDLSTLNQYAVANGACAGALDCTTLLTATECTSPCFWDTTPTCILKVCVDAKAPTECTSMAGCSWDGTLATPACADTTCASILTIPECNASTKKCKWDATAATPVCADAPVPVVCSSYTVQADCAAQATACVWGTTCTNIV